MKRAILIATGTVGGLGAVLAITPPTFTSTENTSMALPGTAVDPVGVKSSATPTASKSAAPAKSSSTTKPSTPKPAATNSAQEQAPVVATPTKKAVSGTFTGDSVDVRYGYVPVSYTHLTLPTNREV